MAATGAAARLTAQVLPGLSTVPPAVRHLIEVHRAATAAHSATMAWAAHKEAMAALQAMVLLRKANMAAALWVSRAALTMAVAAPALWEAATSAAAEAHGAAASSATPALRAIAHRAAPKAAMAVLTMTTHAANSVAGESPAVASVATTTDKKVYFARKRGRFKRPLFYFATICRASSKESADLISRSSPKISNTLRILGCMFTITISSSFRLQA